MNMKIGAIKPVSENAESTVPYYQHKAALMSHAEMHAGLQAIEALVGDLEEALVLEPIETSTWCASALGQAMAIRALAIRLLSELRAPVPPDGCDEAEAVRS
jgi:hypothetical protein